MTQEEKELLLRDLAQRLPYRLLVHTDFDDCPLILKELSYNGEYYAVGGYYTTLGGDYTTLRYIKFSEHPCKPYLRPTSSMTDDEIMQERRLLLDLCIEEKVNQHTYIDWLNAHYFDYRGLIEIGLALVAPEGIYDYQYN